MARKAVADLRLIVGVIVPVSDETVELAMDLRRDATARIATVDCLIAATAALNGAILVHRDPLCRPAYGQAPPGDASG